MPQNIIQKNEDPFTVIRGRRLLGALLVSSILSGVIVTIAWPEWTKDNPLPLLDALSGVLWFGCLVLILYRVAGRARLNWSLLLGRRLNGKEFGRYALFVFPLVAVALGSIYILYLPLSYVFPEFVQWLLIEPSSIEFWTKGEGYIAANIVNFIVVVLFGPVVEELFFRGLLLTRWSLKWSVPTAIAASSLIFGFLHADIIGAVFFGYVMSIIYIRSQSLYAPIAIHIFNNALVWFLVAGDALLKGSEQKYTLADFRSEWWIGALGLVIGIPWAIWFVKRNLLSKDWGTLPYWSNRGR